MFRHISKAERERRAARAELETTVQALHANERAFKEAQDPFYIEQLTYQHAALLCRWRALLRILRADRENLGRSIGPSSLRASAYWLWCGAPPASGTACAVCWPGLSAG